MRIDCESNMASANDFLLNLRNKMSSNIVPLLEDVYGIKKNIKTAIDRVMARLNEWKRSNVKADEQVIGSYDEVKSSKIRNHTSMWPSDSISLQHGGHIPLDSLAHIQVSFYRFLKKVFISNHFQKNVHFLYYFHY